MKHIGKIDVTVEDIKTETQSGKMYQKEEIEEVHPDLEIEEKIVVEESFSKKKRGKSIQMEEKIINVELEDQPSKVEEKPASKRKPSKGKMIEIEEIETVQINGTPQTPTEIVVDAKSKTAISASKEEVIQDEFKVSKRKDGKLEILEEISSQKAVFATKEEASEAEGPKRRESKVEILQEVKSHKAIAAIKDDIVEVENEIVGVKRQESKIETVDDKTGKAILASKEDIEIVDNEVASSKRKQSKVEDIEKGVPQKPIAATKEDIVEIESDVHKLNRRESKIETLEKDEPQIGVSATKESATEVESDATKSRRKASKTVITEEEPQKGVRTEDEEIDEDVEELLRRAKRQRSQMEEIQVQEVEGPEGIVDFKQWDALSSLFHLLRSVYRKHNALGKILLI